MARAANATDLASANAVATALRLHAGEARARVSSSFFKTGKGEYGEGDRFLGVTVPESRAIAKRARGLGEPELEKLLASPWHEERLVALLVLVARYERGDAEEKAKVAAFYVARLAHANSWDLVDLSAWQILGRHLRATRTAAEATAELLRYARSAVLWERRVAMVSTYAWIKEGEAAVAFVVAAELLEDREDLMHKAVGWMLREVGKRVSREALVGFLEAHVARMPRTALRYAIEHFSPEERAAWLARPSDALRRRR